MNKTMANTSEHRTQAATANSSARKWTLTDVNFWLDCLLALVFLTLLGISMVIRFVFPQAKDSKGWLLWSYNYDEWLQAQFVVLIVLTLLILVHVMLHWNWVCNVARLRFRRNAEKKVDTGWQTIVGVGLIILMFHILGIIYGLALLTVRHG